MLLLVLNREINECVYLTEAKEEIYEQVTRKYNLYHPKIGLHRLINDNGKRLLNLSISNSTGHNSITNIFITEPEDLQITTFRSTISIAIRCM